MAGEPDLLAYALFDVDERARGLQRPLLAFLISLALFERGAAATRVEIRAACKDQFASEDEIDQGEFDSVIAGAVKAGLLVKVKQNEVDLSDERREQLGEAASTIARQREEFHAEIRKRIEEELGEKLQAEAAACLENEMEELVQRLFQERSVALAHNFGPEGKGFDEEISGLVAGKSLESVSRSVLGSAEKLRGAQLVAGARGALAGLSESGRRHLAAVYQKTVAFALLQQDPSVRKVKRDLARKRVFYLDTNVAMALLFSAHPGHEEARSAVEAARRLECGVVVSPFTVEELERQLSEANMAYGRLGRRTEALAIADDDILRTYAARRKQSTGLSWTAFRAEYSPPKDALEEYGVKFEETDAVKAHHDERRQKVRDAVAAQKNVHSNTHPKLIDYDTDNLLVVQVRRESLHADEMGSRVWFVTLDRSLKGIERKLVRDRVFQIPSSRRMAAWSAELSPHLAPEDPDLGEYVLHLVQSKVGMLAEDPAFAQVNFLATLEESPFDIGKLLDGEPEMARRVLVALQEEREIRELLGKEPEEVESKEEWAKQVAEAVEKALARLESTAEEREELGRMRKERDRAVRDAVALRRERDRSRRRAAELEEERAGAEREASEKHLWQRLREALRPRKD